MKQEWDLVALRQVRRSQSEVVPPSPQDLEPPAAYLGDVPRTSRATLTSASSFGYHHLEDAPDTLSIHTPAGVRKNESSSTLVAEEVDDGTGGGPPVKGTANIKVHISGVTVGESGDTQSTEEDEVFDGAAEGLPGWEAAGCCWRRSLVHKKKPACVCAQLGHWVFN